MCSVKKVFFPLSEKMSDGKLRKVIRGLEYINSYKAIFNYLKKKGYVDIIHINWLLFYSLDIRFIRRLKKYCRKLVYTAHNAVPHVMGDKSTFQLEKIYECADTVIIHGKTLEMKWSLSFLARKRSYIFKSTDVFSGKPKIPNGVDDFDAKKTEILSRASQYKRVAIFFGAIFPNKGVDRLVHCWLQKRPADSLLIVAGKCSSVYPELEAVTCEMAEKNNMIYLDGFVDDAYLNKLISISDIIFLPYRHASMSGVVFTAAQFRKTLLCTKVGALPEYLESESDSFICENDDAAFGEAVMRVLNVDKTTLMHMGEKLHDNINRKCDWTAICNGLVNNVYDNRGVKSEINK
jgi:glycosyltransferase involved in cell wall biosynthesis